MENLMAIVVGVMFSAGIYLMLRRSLIRIILGICLLSHGVNLLLFTMGGLARKAVPVLGGDSYTDPLVQALILTAIVISFGVTALMLVVAYRSHQTNRSDDIDESRRLKG
jgi:multicomponent Na+:H+ antiporter subunit C